MNNNKRKQVRLLGKILFVLYVAFIIYFLLFSDLYGRNAGLTEYHYNLIPFKEIKRFWNYRHEVGLFAMVTNLFGNVIIFIPFGFFLPMASKYRNFLTTLFWGFGLSLCVETFQLISKVGSFDVDDLMLNTLGCIIGHILFSVLIAIRKLGSKNKESE